MTVRSWKSALIMMLVIGGQFSWAAGVPGPPHWQNLQRALEIIGASEAQRIVIEREYLKLESAVAALVEAAGQTRDLNQYAPNRIKALHLLQEWRDTISPYLIEAQLEMLDGFVVGVDPWRADSTVYGFAGGGSTVPFVPEQLVLELPVTEAEQGALLRKLSSTARARYEALVRSLADYEEFRRRLYRASWDGANLQEWIETVGWEETIAFQGALEANRDAVNVEATTRDSARVMLWALVVAQQVPDAAAPMLAVAHLLRHAGPETSRVWDHFEELHNAVRDLIAFCDSQGGKPLMACSPEESDARVYRVLDEASRVQDIVRSNMWVDTGHKFQPQSMRWGLYVLMRSAEEEVPADRDEAAGRTRILKTAKDLGLDAAAIDALSNELQQSLLFGAPGLEGWLEGWMAMNFIDLVLTDEGLASPTEDEWAAVIAVRLERIRKLKLAQHDQQFNPRTLLDLADQECDLVLRAMTTPDQRMDVERRLWRRANPVVAAQTDVRRDAARLSGERTLREITPLLLEWERAGRRTIGWNAPGASIGMLDEDESRVLEAERAVRAAMIEMR